MSRRRRRSDGFLLSKWLMRASTSRFCHASASRKRGSRATATSRSSSSSGPNTSSPETGKPVLRTANSGHSSHSPESATFTGVTLLVLLGRCQNLLDVPVGVVVGEQRLVVGLRRAGRAQVAGGRVDRVDRV